MMGRVTINHDPNTQTGSTVVSNVFIDMYMTEANDAQLKIYLYLLRMMRAGLPTSLSDLADRFNLTEKDVTRALKFWEKRGLISMEYGNDKTLMGIHIEDLPETPAADNKEPVSAVPAEEAVPAAAIPDAEAVKATYDAAKLNRLNDSDDCSQLVFIAEQYLGRPLSPQDLRSLLYIHESLAFSDALLDYLMQYCVERGKKDFRYMERVAIRWKQSGYETPEQAKRGAFKYDKRVYEVMNLLGLNNLPTETEAAFVERWISEYHLAVDVIREACSRTVLATQKHRLEYADKILTSWHDAGVLKKSDIKQLDDAFESGRKNIRVPQQASMSQRGGARIRNFPQRDDYDIALIEKALVRN